MPLALSLKVRQHIDFFLSLELITFVHGRTYRRAKVLQKIHW